MLIQLWYSDTLLRTIHISWLPLNNCIVQCLGVWLWLAVGYAVEILLFLFNVLTCFLNPWFIINHNRHTIPNSVHVYFRWPFSAFHFRNRDLSTVNVCLNVCLLWCMGVDKLTFTLHINMWKIVKDKYATGAMAEPHTT